MSKKSFSNTLLLLAVLLTSSFTVLASPLTAAGLSRRDPAPGSHTPADWREIRSQARLPAAHSQDSVSSIGGEQIPVYFKGSNTEAEDLFGSSVAISGDTLVVGAVGDDSGDMADPADNSAEHAGAGYVFVRSNGRWVQQAYLKASNPEAGDNFGTSVSISGDTIVVGAEGEDGNRVDGESDNSASEAGAAYVFVRSGTTWSQQAYLKASNAESGDHFGNSVSISGNTIAVAAYQEDSSATGVNGNQSDNSAPDSGAAYAFTRSGTSWSQQAYLKASNTDPGDLFGYQLAVGKDKWVADSDLLVVGAPHEAGNRVDGQSDNSAFDAGAAYSFFRTGATWEPRVYMKAPNADAGDQFGRSVAIADNAPDRAILVGAPWESSAASGVNGDQADNTKTGAGAAYIFAYTSGTGTYPLLAYLKASNPDPVDNFGNSVALSYMMDAVVGAYYEDSASPWVNGDQADNSAYNSGAAYYFYFQVGEGGGFKQGAYLKASNPDADDRFGWQVAISREIFSGNPPALVGARQEDSAATGINGDQADNSAVNSGAVYFPGPLRIFLPVVQSGSTP